MLLDQDRGRWDQLLVHRGLAALAHAETLARPLGPYALQAAIAACHARARVAEETDWQQILALYDTLVELTGSPIVELNRAIAAGMALGAAAGRCCCAPAFSALIDLLVDEPALARYHLLPSVRGDLLAKLGPQLRSAHRVRAVPQRSHKMRASALCSSRAQTLVHTKPRVLTLSAWSPLSDQA